MVLILYDIIEGYYWPVFLPAYDGAPTIEYFDASKVRVFLVVVPHECPLIIPYIKKSLSYLSRHINFSPLVGSPLSRIESLHLWRFSTYA
jgi:hypothetical protein